MPRPFAVLVTVLSMASRDIQVLTSAVTEAITGVLSQASRPQAPQSISNPGPSTDASGCLMR